MSTAAIHEFLKTPGVVGIAIIQGLAISCLYSRSQELAGQEKYHLIHELRKAILTNQDLLNHSQVLEIAILDYCVCFYPLKQNLKLLVLTQTANKAIKLLAARRVQSELQRAVELGSFDPYQFAKQLHRDQTAMGDRSFRLDILDSQLTNPITSRQELTLEQALLALNQLSEVVCDYLGPKITANYWQMTRPGHQCLAAFQISQDGEITASTGRGIFLDPVLKLGLREWSNRFMHQCCQIIPDLPSRVEKKGLDHQSRKLLSIFPAASSLKGEYLSQQEQALF